MIILTDGKTKWELSEEEFEEFQMRFEENELIEVPPNYDTKQVNEILTDYEEFCASCNK